MHAIYLSDNKCFTICVNNFAYLVLKCKGNSTHFDEIFRDGCFLKLASRLPPLATPHGYVYVCLPTNSNAVLKYFVTSNIPRLLRAVFLICSILVGKASPSLDTGLRSTQLPALRCKIYRYKKETSLQSVWLGTSALCSIRFAT